MDERVQAFALMFVLSTACCWGGNRNALGQDREAQRSPVPLVEIRRLNDVHAQALQAVTITAVVTESYRSRSEEMETSRERIESAILAASGVRSAAVDVDRDLIIANINKRTRVRRRAAIDFARLLVRYDDEDLRDLSALIQANGLSGNDVAALSRTQSMVMDGSQTVRLIPSQSLAVVAPEKGDYAHATGGRELGIIPSWVFDGRYIADVGFEDDTTVVLTCRDSTASRTAPFARVWLDSSIEYRVERIEAYDESGSVVERFLASDYRLVAGQYLPFFLRTTRARDGIEDYYVREVAVERIECNPDLSAEQMRRIPEGYVVQDLQSGKVTLPPRHHR